MQSFGMVSVGFWVTAIGGGFIGADRYEQGATFPWRTLVGVLLACAGSLVLWKARALAFAEGRSAGPAAGSAAPRPVVPANQGGS